MSTTKSHPTPPFPKQHQPKPGIESRLRPRPEFKAPEYRGSDKLRGSVALITGGDSGIGRAVAVLFAREGADVAIVYLPVEESDAKTTEKAVKDEGGRTLRIPGDVQDPEFCAEAVDRTVEKFGRLDILVNNAAYQQHQKSIEDITDEQLDRTFRTNIYAYFYMTRAALPHLKPGNTIINTGSITGLEGSRQLLDYSATKGAIHAFTKSLHRPRRHEILVIACRPDSLAPSPFDRPKGRQVRGGYTAEIPAHPRSSHRPFLFRLDSERAT